MPTYAVTGNVTSTNGETTLKSDELTFTKVEAVTYDLAPSTVQRATFTVTGSGGSFPFKIKPPVLPNSNWKHAGSMAILNFLGQTSASVVTFTAQPASVNEGSEATFTVQATNVEAGIALQWVLVHVGEVSNDSHYDITYGLSGAVTLDNATTPTGTFKVKPVQDETTNPTGKQKQFKIEIKRGGIVVATSNTITVNDTSLGPIYSVSLSPTTVNEGEIVTATISCTNPRIKGQSLRWKLVEVPSHYASSLSTYFESQGVVTVADTTGTGSFTIQVHNDNLDNPVAKTFKVQLTTMSGVPLFTTPSAVTVNDTSKTPGLSTIVASGGAALAGGNLNGLSVYAISSFTTQAAGGGVSLFNDGTWFARSTQGTVQTGNWFTPTTKEIGSNYYVKITSTPSTVLGGGGDYGGETDWTPLNYTINFFAEASNYTCVDPDTAILVNSDGTTKLAKDLVVGENVYTMHEITKQWNYYKILSHEIISQPKTLVTFEDNSTLLVSNSHKVYLGRDIWKHIFDLNLGDRVVTHNSGMKTITSLKEADTGNVVSMEIEKAHTYVANDIVSHNKVGRGINYSSEYERTFTVQISNEPSASGSSYSTNTVTIGGQVGIPL